MFNILIKIKNQFKLGSLIQPSFTAKNKLSSFIGSFIAISILGFISKESGYSILIAPFGASTVLVFGLPNSPLAQPRNLILGNLWAPCLRFYILCYLVIIIFHVVWPLLVQYF